MLYRKLAGCEVSALGFGCMRLPVIGNDMSKIDEPEASRMLNYAIEHGVNYLDTAWPYHGEQSEGFVGKFLEENNLRDKIYLATKLPSWHVQTREDCDRFLNQQLEKLRTDHIDFYLVHALGTKLWEQVINAGVIDFLEEAKKTGKIIHIGFSFHDDQDAYFPIVDAYDWEFTQIMVNYMDEEFQAGAKGFDYAVSKGLDVIAMEPLRGGKLTQKVPPEIQGVWNKPEVATVLSGMTAMEHVVENIEVVEHAHAGTMSVEELEIVERLKNLYRERTVIDCTDCRYCLPCPSNVAIPNIFSTYNDFHIYGDEKSARFSYRMFIEDEMKADNCTECGECEEKCPQQIEIIKWLKKSHETLMSD